MESLLELRALPRGGFVACGDSVGWLRERGYGTEREGCQVLELHEALYLVERGSARAMDGSGSPLDAPKMIIIGSRRDDRFLTKYIVYRDLRNRGYVVRGGYGIGSDFRVYRRGEYGERDARYLVVAMEEGSRMSASRLAGIYLRALNLGKELVLAVVESHGDVVYYSVIQF
ncbi:MAG: tRNA-intron lyase, partial [Conexivisphaera sp.]